MLKIGDSIELAVVWGTKVPLTEKLNKKLNELDDTLYKDDGTIIHGAYVRWSKDNFLEVIPVEPEEAKEDKLIRLKQKPFGLLFADFGQGIYVKDEKGKDTEEINIGKIHPSASVGYILETVLARHANIAVKIEDDILMTLYERWIPCVTKRLSSNISTVAAVAEFEFDPRFMENKLSVKKGHKYNLINEGRASINIPIGTYEVELMKKNNAEFIETAYIIDPNKYPNPEANSRGWQLELSIGAHYHRCGGVTAEQHYLYGKQILSLSISDVDVFKKTLTHIHEGSASEYKVDVRFYNSSLGLYVPITVIEYEEGKFQTFELPVTVSITQKIDSENEGVVAIDTDFPIVANLPEMTCTDFIKSICQMYALFPHFNLETNMLEFMQIDDIIERKNVAKTKNWDNKVLDEGWSIERSFGDYARRNRFRYQEDDTVTTKSEAFMELENQALVAERDLIDLKFSATDLDDYGLAYLPLYKTADAGEKPQSIKPRILSQGKLSVKVDDKSKAYKTLSFDVQMKFETKKEGLIDLYYSRYKDVVSTPVIRDVAVLLSEIDLMNMSTLDIIYLRGKYWMPMKIQVEVNGKAKARLILLPNIF